MIEQNNKDVVVLKHPILKRIRLKKRKKSVFVTHLCSSLRMWTLKVRGVTTAGSGSGGKASGGGTQVLNSDSQFCSVFTWNNKKYIHLKKSPNPLIALSSHFYKNSVHVIRVTAQKPHSKQRQQACSLPASQVQQMWSVFCVSFWLLMQHHFKIIELKDKYDQ